MCCGSGNVFYSINNSILHGNDFSQENTDRKEKKLSEEKYKEKEPGGSSGKRRQYCIIRNWSVVLYHGSFHVNVFVAF